MEEQDLPAPPGVGATAGERAASGQDTARPKGNPDGSRPQAQATGGQGDTAQAAASAAGTATDLARDAYDSAATAAGSIRDRVVDTAQQQQNAAADGVDTLADSLRRTAESLPPDQGWLSDLTNKGGQQLSDLADTLRRNDLQGLLQKVDGFARTQPALFLGASMAAGFALARVAQVSVAQMNKPTPPRAAHERTPPDASASPPYASTTAAEPGRAPTDDPSPYVGTGERRGETKETPHG